MGVSQYALTTLAAAKDYLGSVPEVNGIWVYSPSPTAATAATVEVTDTTMVLIITGGASAGTTTLTFSDSDTDTIAELVTKINALTGKWKAGAIGNGSAASTDLLVTGAQSCLGASNEITLRMEDNYGVEKLVDRATDLIERYCGRKIYTRSYDRVQYTGNGRETLVLNQYPVTRVFRVSEGKTNAFYVTNATAVNFATVEVSATKLRLNADGTVTDLTLSSYATINLLIAAINGTSGWTATLINAGTRKPTYTGSGGTTVSELIPMPAQRCLSPNVAYVEVPDTEIDDYWIMAGGGDEDRDAGILMREGGWARGETYYIDFLAGYTTIPAALEEACLMLVKYARDKQSKDSSIQAEGLGDYNYSIGVMGNTFGKEMIDQIKLFRSFEF
jgi:hypothetical protein